MPDDKHFLEETKDSSGKFILSKFEHDLFHDEDNVKLPIIRVKHYALKGNGDRWKVFSDAQLVLVIEGSKLNKKERIFLRSLDGINFVISQQKVGIKSFNSFKIALKEVVSKKKLDKK